ncbi:MAG: cyclase family protein [Tepidiformaceae bacterium]
MSSWIDITVPIRPGMVLYEGDPPVVLDRITSMAAGGPSNLTGLRFGAHTGTHIDAPLHFIEAAPGIEATRLDALLGPVTVVDATAIRSNIDAAALDQLGLSSTLERIIFKTTNSRLWDLDRFSPDFVGLTEDAARSLVDRGVRLVGIDYLSIAPFSDPAPTHIALLSAGVVILEGLDLRAVPPGDYELACLPLLIPGSDGAPARALLRRGSRQ